MNKQTNKRMSKQTNEWTNEQTNNWKKNEQMKKQANKKMNKQTNKGMNKQTKEWTNEQTNSWTKNEQMNKQTNKWTNKWTLERNNEFIHSNILFVTPLYFILWNQEFLQSWRALETLQTNGYECQTRVVHDGITVETHREQRASETVGGTDFADSSESYLHL